MAEQEVGGELFLGKDAPAKAVKEPILNNVMKGVDNQYESKQKEIGLPIQTGTGKASKFDHYLVVATVARNYHECMIISMTAFAVFREKFFWR